ncbi:MAG: ferrous iron transport protein A [Candidatus Omnitrophica bacterium]|nr:ferrous iron transport protein A [Candidatus Omnitrophota bacterium]MDE2222213.1 ferrous iron transport protein A [Candidatus Omnitrophota bacterium]
MPKDSQQLTTLSNMPVGQKALIAAFAVDTDQGEHIQKMGFVPGEILEVVRAQADRIEVKIGQYFVSLNKTEADCIKVKPFL